MSFGCGCKGTAHDPGCFMLTQTNLHRYSDSSRDEAHAVDYRAVAIREKARADAAEADLRTLLAQISDADSCVARRRAAEANAERLAAALRDMLLSHGYDMSDNAAHAINEDAHAALAAHDARVKP